MNFPDVRRVATCERLSSLGKGGYAMLIKSADDQGVELQALEQRAAGKGPDAARAAKELRNRRAGLKGERDSAYLIDFDYASSPNWAVIRSEEHTSELQSLMRNSYAVFCLKQKNIR